MAEQGKISPIIVFPEGTTSNGRGLMKFKKGPFVIERPFKVYSLYYNSDFIPCYNLVDILSVIFIFLSSWVNRITYYKFK